jgi:hypothetical protein
VETRMFNHFAQTKENKANFLDAQVPNKRIGTPEEIANAASLALTRPPNHWCILSGRWRDDRRIILRFEVCSFIRGRC